MHKFKLLFTDTLPLHQNSEISKTTCFFLLMWRFFLYRKEQGLEYRNQRQNFSFIFVGHHSVCLQKKYQFVKHQSDSSVHPPTRNLKPSLRRITSPWNLCGTGNVFCTSSLQAPLHYKLKMMGVQFNGKRGEFPSSAVCQDTALTNCLIRCIRFGNVLGLETPEPLHASGTWK